MAKNIGKTIGILEKIRSEGDNEKLFQSYISVAEPDIRSYHADGIFREFLNDNPFFVAYIGEYLLRDNPGSIMLLKDLRSAHLACYEADGEYRHIQRADELLLERVAHECDVGKGEKAEGLLWELVDETLADDETYLKLAQIYIAGKGGMIFNERIKHVMIKAMDLKISNESIAEFLAGHCRETGMGDRRIIPIFDEFLKTVKPTKKTSVEDSGVIRMDDIPGEEGK